MTGALVVQADALRLPLPDESVDLCITSPPFFALRSYSTAHKQHEIGSEPTPAAYLEALWAATAEMVRVLKPTGSMFVDLGDKYVADNRGSGIDLKRGEAKFSPAGPQGYVGRELARQKSLMLLPERYRVGCVDRLGLIARAVIVWQKPNGLPESVTDRVRRSHEDWVHLTKQPRYYSAVDEVREPHAQSTHARALYGHQQEWPEPYVGVDKARTGLAAVPPNPLGKLPGSVWSIPSEPLRLPEHLGVDHYAAFPSEWPRRLILGWSPPGICLDCGQGRVPVVERDRRPHWAGGSYHSHRNGGGAEANVGDQKMETTATILGYACSCTPYTDHPGSGERPPRADYQFAGGIQQHANPGGGLGNSPKYGPWREYHLEGWNAPPTRPSVVLDPFSGTGTTIGVARQLGRLGIGVDLSHAYSRAARYRVFQSGDFAKAEARTNLERQGSLL